MDAYCDYVRQTAETRLGDLRREAANDRLARELTASKASRWSGLRARLQRRTTRRATVPGMAEPVRLPRPMKPDSEGLRRTA